MIENAFDQLLSYTTEKLIDCLPENVVLYKDSGMWQFMSDDMERVLLHQEPADTFRSFIFRYIETLGDRAISEILQNVRLKF